MLCNRQCNYFAAFDIGDHPYTVRQCQTAGCECAFVTRLLAVSDRQLSAVRQAHSRNIDAEFGEESHALVV